MTRTVHIFGWPFFIRGNEKADAALVIGVRVDEVFTRDHHGRQAGFHVRGAATYQVRARFRGYEGIRLPLFAASGGHNVSVSGKYQQRSG